MKVDEVTTVQIGKDVHHRLRIISAHTKKKLYELIKESTEMLEVKYHLISGDQQ